jgi:hypothetical protein
MLILMQMLPFAHIGQALGQSRWTEELPHNVEDGKAETFTSYSHPFLPPAAFTTNRLVYVETKASAYIHISEQIPTNHSTEVVSPPPDTAVL